MPLPHISASLPSALMMRMRTSAIAEFKRISVPSAPTPVWRSQTFTVSAVQSTSSVFLPSNSTKSFPSPCTL